MERALVLIGVQLTGGLPQLPAVGNALREMRDWADHQGIPDELIVEISDLAGAAVLASDVKAKVKALVDRPTLTQLIIFFCGHGLAATYNSELWLLSGAQDDANEAVNVAGSVNLAASGPVPHVVFISDACRLPATTVNAQFLIGTVIMPIPKSPGPSQNVDVFYACQLGSPANQVQDAASAQQYHSVFTEVFTDGLEGDYPESIDLTVDAGVAVGLVRSGPLKDSLPGRLADRLAALGVGLTKDQRPDALVSYNPKGWLSRVPAPEAPTPPMVAPHPPGARPEEDLLEFPGPGPDPQRRRRGRRRPPASVHAPTGTELAEHAAAEAADRLRLPIRWAISSGAGIQLRGATVRDVVGGGGATCRADGDGAAVAVHLPDGVPGAPVVISLDNGSCTVVPVIADHTSVVTVEDGQLVDVWLAPHRGSHGDLTYPDFHARVASRERYRLALPQTGWGEAIATDPSLAIYRAYALADSGYRDEIAQVSEALEHTIGTTFFDIELMVPGKAPTALPGVPLLSRGWALLDDTEMQADLPAPIFSLWTLFPETAFHRLQFLATKRSRTDA